MQASAITVHKSQGGTYSAVVYKYARTHPQKLVYVALSRCTNLNNLYLTNAAGDHHFYHKVSNVDKNMVDEFQRLENHRLDTITKRYLHTLQTNVDPDTEFSLALLNTTSLACHVKDTERDPVLTKATVLCLTETWNAPQPSIDGYRVIVCTDNAEHPSGGVAIYVKHSLTAVDLKLPLTSQSHNGEHAAITLHTGTDIVIMTMYLAPNLSSANVETYIDKAMVTYDKTYKETVPFILAGEFNVDLMKKGLMMSYMASHYSLR